MPLHHLYCSVGKPHQLQMEKENEQFFHWRSFDFCAMQGKTSLSQHTPWKCREQNKRKIVASIPVFYLVVFFWWRGKRRCDWRAPIPIFIWASRKRKKHSSIFRFVVSLYITFRKRIIKQKVFSKLHAAKVCQLITKRPRPASLTYRTFHSIPTTKWNKTTQDKDGQDRNNKAFYPGQLPSAVWHDHWVKSQRETFAILIV